MIITCPRCTARYVVDPDRFGFDARRARCSNCGHVWHAEPDASIDAALPPPPAVAPPPSLPDDFDALDDAPEDDAGSGVRALWTNDDEFASVPAPAAAPSEPPAANVRSGFEDAPPPDDDEDLDIELGGDAEPRGSETDSNLGSEPELEDVSAAMPSARDAVIAAAAAKAKRERRRALIIAGGAVTALLLSAIVLVSLQAPLTRAIPGMAALYHVVGLAAAPPGANLDIGEVSSSREWADGEDVLVVTGTVTNTAKEARELPPLRVALFDAADRQVQEAIVEPEKSVLAPGENVRFNARIAGPANTARRMVVSFDTTAAGAS